MNMRKANQVIMHKLSVIVIISSIAISATICAPQAQAQQQQPQQQLQQNPSTSQLVLSNQQQQQGHQTSASVNTNTNNNNNNNNHHYNQRQQASSTTTPLDQSSIAPAASVATGQPSTIPLTSFNNNNNNDNNDAQTESNAKSSNLGPQSSGIEAGSELDMFDGKSPFTDDSLWQIPFQMVGDLTSVDAGKQPHDQMAKSASETSSLNDSDEDDDDEQALGSAPIQSPQSPSASLSAQQEPAELESSAGLAGDDAGAKGADLKTAAGYHYPTHGGHHGGAHHHQGADYHGGHGYFQYVKVPKPKAYEFGYRRGNSKHTIERYEKAHGPHFQTKVKWSDKHGHGSHTWDYNHGDHHSDHYDDDHHQHDHHQKKYQPKKHY